MKQVRIWAVGLALLSLVGLVYLAGTISAGENKMYVDGVKKIADLLRKGDKDGAAKEAASFSKKIGEDGLVEVMYLFKLRKKGGWGVGDKAGVITPDGIELKLIGLARDGITPATLKKESAALEEMGHVISAIGEVARQFPPKMDKGKKTKKDWLAWTDDMRATGIKLAEASKAKGAQDVKTAAAKLNNSCNLCHSMFRALP
ncbi:MAG: hypothetical protein L0Y72_04850 [Gemmataceae bacterium]|nr:hypothetical protein [Gemmataceae bacterium]MCI0738350.1 hypothetical protein [Gemmataceae bacterium]